MVFKMKNIVSLIIITLNVLNLFISFHHFAHHDHTINPQTGEIEHTHNCGHDHHHEETEEIADNSYNPVKNDHHHTEHDKCETLDTIIKPILKNKLLAVVLYKDIEPPQIKTVFYSNKASSDILSFAPKNSPPVS